ncbi:acyl carrier protein [Streptomyces misionensis]|nr:acyl carrier protein [Streptomyces misionensis]
MTTEDLRQVLRETAGEDGIAVVSEETLDTSFTDLGYDSLAIMETATQLTRRFGSRLDEDELMERRTPRELLNAINHALAQAGS